MSAYVIFDAEIKKCERGRAFTRRGIPASKTAGTRGPHSLACGEERRS